MNVLSQQRDALAKKSAVPSKSSNENYTHICHHT
jgi:hypothetical protein